MGPGDLVTAALILAGACWLLYRSLFKRKGACHGCDSGACRPPAGGLVRLGQGATAPGRRSAAPGDPHRCGGQPIP
jgi:hypothetical protein